MNNHKKLIFFILLILLLVDRIITLVYFGFEYTDIDQVMQWEGALDYANGIFREPFFYGQDYNYMVESFMAAPLVWLDIPVYMALPITTAWLIIFPFVILSIFFFKRKVFFWAYLCLVMPVILPVEYNMLTTMSRGFVQAGLFLPLLFFAIFNPEKGRSVTLFFLGAVLSFMANPSSVILSVPVGIYLWTHHFKSGKFYLKSLIVVPFLFVFWLSKYYYVLHPDKLLLKIEGIDLEISTFLEMISLPYLFEYLFPVFPKLGWVYPIIFLLLAIWFYRTKGAKKQLIFIVTTLVVLLLSLAVPKVIFGEISSLVYYTHSRLFVHLPLVFILLLFFTFYVKKERQNDKKRFTMWSTSLVACVVLIFMIKNSGIEVKSLQIAERTSFPVENLSTLKTQLDYIDSVAIAHDAQVMVTRATMGWQFAFKGLAYNSIMQTKLGHKPKMSAVYNIGDRRTWLFDEVENSKRVLLYVCFIDENILKEFDAEPVGYGLVLIKNNNLPLTELFERLNLAYRFK